MFISGTKVFPFLAWQKFVDEDSSKSPHLPTISLFGVRMTLAFLRISTPGKTPLLALLDQAVVSGTSLLTAVMVGRFCGKEGLGWFTLGMSTMLLANGITGSLITTPYTVFLRRQSGSPATQRAGTTLLSFCILVASLTTVACGVAFACQHGAVGGSQPFLAWSIVVAIPWFLTRDFARRFDFAHLNMTGALIVDGGVAATQLVLLLTLGLQGRLTPSVALLVVGGSCAVMACLWLLARRGAFCFHARRQLATSMWRDWIFGRWLLLDQLIGIGQMNAIYWLLAALLNTSATGALAACCTIAALPNPLFFGVGNYLAPRFAETVSRHSYRDTVRVYRRATLALGGAVSLFTVLACIFGDDLLWLLYRDPGYGGLGIVVGLLALRLALAIPTIAANHAIVAMEGPRGSAIASLLGLLVIFGVAIPVIPLYGVMGAAIALLAGATVETAATLVVFMRYLRRWQWSDVETSCGANPQAIPAKAP